MPKPPALLAMAKPPVPGSTKTRLCPPLTPQQASDVYEALLLDTLAWMARIPNVQPGVAITPSAGVDYFRRSAPAGLVLFPVDGPDIGAVLDQTLTHFLTAGHRCALAVHSDGPTIPTGAIAETVAALETVDLVLGPSGDGGFYLIGLARLQPALFDDIAWSTPQVFEQTLDRAAKLGLTVHCLPPVADVDTVDDLRALAKQLRDWPVTALPHTRRMLKRLDGLV